MAFLLAAASCSEPPAPPVIAAPEPGSQLAVYVGSDLRELDVDEGDELAKLLDPILPEKYRSHEFGFFPWHPWCVWKSVTPDGKPGFILLQVDNTTTRPGESFVAVHQFDSSGKRLSSVEFSVGWRVALESASYQYDPIAKAHVIDTRSKPDTYIIGEDSIRQNYSIVDNRVTVQDESGRKRSHDSLFSP